MNIHSNTLSYNEFRRLLLLWNSKINTRQMPWKGEKDPYKVWLSEVILQQTRVAQGLPYYENFIKKFPTIQDLAHAADTVVFKMWEGLGYYSRCRNMLTTARHIAYELQGVFPHTYSTILQLKGVGPYTAAAIASFSFHLPHAVVDGNVFRVLSRIFGIQDPVDSTAGKKRFTQLAEKLLDAKHPGAYNQAIMDFGAVVCKPVAPLCHSCIFQKHCVAFLAGNANALPVKEKKIAITKRRFYFFVLHYKNTIAIQQRTTKDIWQQLYQFPLIEGATTVEDAMQQALHAGWINNNDEVKKISAPFSQKLTHQSLSAVFITILLKRKPTVLKNFLWIRSDAFLLYAFPKVITTYLKLQ